MDKQAAWRPVITVTPREWREAKAAAALAGVDIQDWLADLVRKELDRQGSGDAA